MIVSEVRALDVLTSKFKLSQEDAREVVVELSAIGGRIHTHIEDEFRKSKDIFLTKDDKVELVEKMEHLRVDLSKKIDDQRVELIVQKMELVERMEDQKAELIERMERIRADTKEDKVELIERIENQKVELVERIERSRADMIKWMFIFWITQLVAMAGLFQFFFNA